MAPELGAPPLAAGAALGDLGSVHGERRAEPPHRDCRRLPPLCDMSDQQHQEFPEGCSTRTLSRICLGNGRPRQRPTANATRPRQGTMSESRAQACSLSTKAGLSPSRKNPALCPSRVTQELLEARTRSARSSRSAVAGRQGGATRWSARTPGSFWTRLALGRNTDRTSARMLVPCCPPAFGPGSYSAPSWGGLSGVPAAEPQQFLAAVAVGDVDRQHAADALGVEPQLGCLGV
jgi:hypothetical protein